MRTLDSIAGNSQRLDGGAMFGNAPKALWSRWIDADSANRIPLACRALLIREDDRLVLLEGGIGAFFSEPLRERYGVVEAEHVLIRSLREVGVAPADIDVIVLSHLHFDHAGGLLTAYREDAAPELVFPEARVVVSDVAWQRAQDPHPRDRASFIPELVALLGSAGTLEVVTGDRSDTLGDGYRFHRSDGHTPGMMLTEVDMPAGPVVFAADLIPGRPWVHLPITMGYDRYPELLIDEKRALLDDLVARGGRLFYTHDAECALSGLRCENGRYRAADPVFELRGLES